MGGELYNDHHKVFWVEVGDKVGLACILLCTPRLSDYGLIQAIHSITTIPIYHYKYNEWLGKVVI